jgi:hypothetical protein
MKTVTFRELAEFSYALKPDFEGYLSSLGIPSEGYIRTWIEWKLLRRIFPGVRYSNGSIGFVDACGDRYAIAVEVRVFEAKRYISRSSMRRILEISGLIK